MKRVKHAAISAFLLFHIVAITCWCIPVNSALISNVRDFVRPYMLWSGLFQGWDMFAPTPPNVNAYIEAAVIYKDGRTQSWKFPRMEQLGLVERYYRERYRKFTENLRQDANAGLWPDVARHIARLNNHDTSNPPAIIILVRYWSEIAAPGANTPGRGRLQGHIFFEYNVKPEDLQ
jgi:hypothetical protein